MLRVIAGKYRGRHLEQPPLGITRPTTDRAKEAIFSSIHFKLEGALVLDVFSGSGSLSIEAVSRGAMKAFAVEQNKKAVEVIEHNVAKLEIPNISIIKRNAIDFLKSSAGTKYDFIFMDPPYKEPQLANDALQAIAQNGILKDLGLIVLETSKPSEIKIPEGLTIQKEKKYGKASILLLANNI